MIFNKLNNKFNHQLQQSSTKCQLFKIRNCQGVSLKICRWQLNCFLLLRKKFFKKKLINLLSFLWNIILSYNFNTVAQKLLRKLKVCKKMIMFINNYFSKKLTCMSMKYFRLMIVVGCNSWDFGIFVKFYRLTRWGLCQSFMLFNWNGWCLLL